MLKKINIKNKVGRPKLASKSLKKVAGIELILAFILCATLIFSGVSVLTGKTSLELLGIHNNLSASVEGQLDGKFVVQRDGDKLTIVPPKNAKYYSVRVYKLNNNNKYIYDSVYNKNSSNFPILELNISSSTDTRYKVFVRWAVTYAGLTYKPSEIENWKPADYVSEYNIGTKWASREYIVKGGGTPTVTTTKQEVLPLVCPSFTYNIEGSTLYVKINPANNNKWDWDVSKDDRILNFFYVYENISKDNSGSQTKTIALNSKFRKKARVVVKDINNKKKKCYTDEFILKDNTTTTKTTVKPTTTTKASTTTRTTTTTTRQTSQSVTINVQGTENHEIGYTANGITAYTNPTSASITWKNSNPNVVRINVYTGNPKKISITVIGAGTSKISAKTSNGLEASFNIVGTVKLEPLLVNNGVKENISYNGINFIVEKGCSSDIVTKQKNILYKLPTYTLKTKQIYLSTNNSFFLQFPSAASNTTGMAAGIRYLALRCDVFYRSTLVHEMAHSWDYNYGNVLQQGNISQQSDLLTIYKKYLNIYNNDGTYPLRTYAYVNVSSPGVEFTADSYTVYFYKYIYTDDGVPTNYKTFYPVDLKNIVDKYINASKGF